MEVRRVATEAEVTSEQPETPRRRGRPALSRDTPLTVETILDAADRIIREEGLDALSMRRLAGDLGVTPRALYNHVPTKAELLDDLIERVWDQTLLGVDLDPTDLVETTVRINLRLREAWIDNGELAVLATAVARNDERRRGGMTMAIALMQAAGFPDIPFAFYTIQNFTMGSVVLRSTRRQSSAYMGRVPADNLASALAEIDAAGADRDQRGIVESQYDVGDDEHFERALRLLVRALLDPDPAPGQDGGGSSG